MTTSSIKSSVNAFVIMGGGGRGERALKCLFRVSVRVPRNSQSQFQ